MISYPLELEIHTAQMVKKCRLIKPSQLHEFLGGTTAHFITIRNVASISETTPDIVEADDLLQELVIAEVKQAGFVIKDSYLNISNQVFDSCFEIVSITHRDQRDHLSFFVDLS